MWITETQCDWNWARVAVPVVNDSSHSSRSDRRWSCRTYRRREWLCHVAASSCCTGRCDACRWTSSAVFTIETPSLWRRRSSHHRDPDSLTWSHGRSSLSASSRGRIECSGASPPPGSRTFYIFSSLFAVHSFWQFCCPSWRMSLNFVWAYYLLTELL